MCVSELVCMWQYVIHVFIMQYIIYVCAYALQLGKDCHVDHMLTNCSSLN